MVDTKIIAATLEVFQECEVRSFPVDCCSLLRHYGYKVYTYKELKMKNISLYLGGVEREEDISNKK